MSKLKIVWRVSPVPTGPYASFSKRGWPSASFNSADGPAASQLSCEDDYDPAGAKSGEHKELKVGVADYSVTPWRWRWLKKRASNLSEAKALVEEFYNKRGDMLPEEVRGGCDNSQK